MITANFCVYTWWIVAAVLSVITCVIVSFCNAWKEFEMKGGTVWFVIFAVWPLATAVGLVLLPLVILPTFIGERFRQWKESPKLPKAAVRRV